MYNIPTDQQVLTSTQVIQTCENCDGLGSLLIYNVYDKNYKKVEVCDCCMGMGLVSVIPKVLIN